MTLTPYQSRMIHVLSIYAQKGKSLADIAVPAIMDRVPGTLKRYCRLGAIQFPDYSPRSAARPSAVDTPERGCVPRSNHAPAPLFDEASK